MAEYKFYITRYSDKVRRDVESYFNCKYVSLDNALSMGDVKNAYTEDFAESDGVRVYIPQSPSHKAVDVTLTLLFDSSTAIADSLRFVNYVSGRMVEWYDDFRGKYITLLLTKSESVQGELLYGGRKYRQVKYTFTNILGKPFDTTQIPS